MKIADKAEFRLKGRKNEMLTKAVRGLALAALLATPSIALAGKGVPRGGLIPCDQGIELGKGSAAGQEWAKTNCYCQGPDTIDLLNNGEDLPQAEYDKTCGPKALSTTPPGSNGGGGNRRPDAGIGGGGNGGGNKKKDGGVSSTNDGGVDGGVDGGGDSSPSEIPWGLVLKILAGFGATALIESILRLKVRWQKKELGDEQAYAKALAETLGACGETVEEYKPKGAEDAGFPIIGTVSAYVTNKERIKLATKKVEEFEKKLTE